MEDPAELVNLVKQYPDKVREMQCALKHKLYECEAWIASGFQSCRQETRSG
jgi:hypothetical protein